MNDYEIKGTQIMEEQAAAKTRRGPEPCKSERKDEVLIQLEQLEKEVSHLAEAIGDIGERTSSVRYEANFNTKEDKGPFGPLPACDLAERIRNTRYELASQRERLNQITDEIQL